jgi:hypothetical protein
MLGEGDEGGVDQRLELISLAAPELSRIEAQQQQQRIVLAVDADRLRVVTGERAVEVDQHLARELAERRRSSDECAFSSDIAVPF